AVLADGLQRGDDMADTLIRCERQQQPFIGNDTPVAVVEIGDGVDGKTAGKAFVVDWHHERREPRSDISVEQAALGGMTLGVRYPRALALDGQARRSLQRFDGIVDEIGQFLLEPCRLVLPDRRHLLLARVKTQPSVKEITLPDRFDDRRSGAFKFQNEYSRR